MKRIDTSALGRLPSTNISTSQTALSAQLPLKSPKSAQQILSGKIPTPNASTKNSPEKQLDIAMQVIIINLIYDRKSSSPSISTGTIRVSLESSEDAFKLFKVSLTDTCSEILTSALKKFSILDVSSNYVFLAKYHVHEKYLTPSDCPFEFQSTLTHVPVFVMKYMNQNPEPNQSQIDALNKQKEDALSQSNLALMKRKYQSQEEKSGEVVSVYVFKSSREGEGNLSIGQRYQVLKNDNGWCMITPSLINHSQTSPTTPNASKNNIKFYPNKETAPVNTSSTQPSYWVPSGCLLEVFEKKIDDVFNDEFHRVVGVTIGEYKGTSGELSFVKADRMVIVKRYREWCIGDVGGVRGWVPSHLIHIDHDQQRLK